MRFSFEEKEKLPAFVESFLAGDEGFERFGPAGHEAEPD